MKTGSLFVGLAALSLVACGGSQKPAESADAKTGSSQAALSSSSASSSSEAPAEPKAKTAAEEWAEKKIASDANAKSATREGGDPLAMNSDVEAASIPKIELTPAKELHTKSRADLQAAVGLVKTESSVDGAAKKITQRLGKPTWTENGQKRVWVAPAGNQCHRLILEADGSVEVETASKTEWRGLSALAQQNPCTGEIKRGISSGK